MSELLTITNPVEVVTVPEPEPTDHRAEAEAAMRAGRHTLAHFHATMYAADEARQMDRNLPRSVQVALAIAGATLFLSGGLFTATLIITSGWEGAL